MPPFCSQAAAAAEQYCALVRRIASRSRGRVEEEPQWDHNSFHPLRLSNTLTNYRCHYSDKRTPLSVDLFSTCL